MYPLIETDLGKLRSNIDYMIARCHERGLTVAAVTKGVCADERITAMLDTTDVDFLADSRILNLASYKTSKPRMLIRVPMLSEVEQAVKYSDVCLISEKKTALALAKAAKEIGRTYRLILMIDAGDLREGIFFKNDALIYETAEAIVNAEGAELYGIGANFSCFGGIIPEDENLGYIISWAEKLRERFGIALPLVSGGNSSTVYKLMDGTLPEGITNLRIGESWLLGTDTTNDVTFDDMNTDAFTLKAELVEVMDKPSKPIGNAGLNAFGEPVEFPDLGPMRRGIAAIGRQDIGSAAIVPLDERIKVLGGSSDHTLLDLTRADGYKVGDIISFNVKYGSMLAAFTSKYIHKIYKGD